MTLEFTAKCLSNSPSNVVIGYNCRIRAVFETFDKGKTTIGNNCFINFNSHLGAIDSITIGDDVIISTDVRIFDNNNHPTSPAMRRKMSRTEPYSDLWTWKYADHKPITICDNVFIGEHSTILKGITIGKGAFVACRSVVTKDVPEYCMVAGNPARVVKKLDTDGTEEEDSE